MVGWMLFWFYVVLVKLDLRVFEGWFLIWCDYAIVGCFGWPLFCIVVVCVCCDGLCLLVNLGCCGYCCALRDGYVLRLTTQVFALHCCTCLECWICYFDCWFWFGVYCGLLGNYRFVLFVFFCLWCTFIVVIVW